MITLDLSKSPPISAMKEPFFRPTFFLISTSDEGWRKWYGSELDLSEVYSVIKLPGGIYAVSMIIDECEKFSLYIGTTNLFDENNTH